jgi:hypothetical protein
MRTAGLNLDQAPQLDIPLRFFLTAPLFGVAAGVLLAVLGAELLATPWHPHTVALAHLVTLGVLTMSMLGALYQLLPVVMGVEVPGARWSRWLHPVFTGAVLLLAAGLLLGLPVLLVAALVLLAASLLPLLGQHVWCLARGASHGPFAPLLRLALGALLGTIALGLLFGSGHAMGWWPLPRQAAMPVHVYWSLGGWVGGLIASVGMTVLPMFYIAPPFPRGLVLSVLVGLSAMLLAAPLVMGLSIGPGWSLLPLGCGAIALAAFTGGLLRLLRARRRKVADVSLRYWEGGLLAAWLALVPGALHAVWPHPRWLFAFGVVYLLGFAYSVLSGMLCKIVPFLVWMNRFSHLAGKTPIPMMGELLPRRHAQRQLACHVAAVLLLTAAALAPYDPLVRLGGLALALSSGYLWANLLHAALFRPATPAAQPSG